MKHPELAFAAALFVTGCAKETPPDEKVQNASENQSITQAVQRMVEKAQADPCDPDMYVESMAEWVYMRDESACSIENTAASGNQVDIIQTTGVFYKEDKQTLDGSETADTITVSRNCDRKSQVIFENRCRGKQKDGTGQVIHGDPQETACFQALEAMKLTLRRFSVPFGEQACPAKLKAFPGKINSGEKRNPTQRGK